MADHMLSWVSVKVNIATVRLIQNSTSDCGWWSLNSSGHGFYKVSIGITGPNVCQENIPHTITPPAAYTADTRQDEVMYCSCSQWSHFFLFLADRSGTRSGRSSAAIANPWQGRKSSARHFCAVICLFVARLLACTILAILLWPRSSTSCFHPHDYRWLDVFCLWHHS